jgi:hypothetical protein
MKSADIVIGAEYGISTTHEWDTKLWSLKQATVTDIGSAGAVYVQYAGQERISTVRSVDVRVEWGKVEGLRAERREVEARAAERRSAANARFREQSEAWSVARVEFGKVVAAAGIAVRAEYRPFTLTLTPEALDTLSAIISEWTEQNAEEEVAA